MVLREKIRIEGILRFNTAFHIGSGRPGVTISNMGVLLDPTGKPILPGSSLKGKFRATAEKLAHVLGLTACLLDRSLSGVNCISDEKYRKQEIDKYKCIKDGPQKIAWINNNTCQICHLFGSPLQAGRIFFSEGELIEGTWAEVVQTRDGVVIDRDSERARDGLKYDFDVIPAGAEFKIWIELINPTQEDMALCGAVIHEWQEGTMIGGFTSRGLGLVKLNSMKVECLDYTDPAQRIAALTGTGWKNVGMAQFDKAISSLPSLAKGIE